MAQSIPYLTSRVAVVIPGVPSIQTRQGTSAATSTLETSSVGDAESRSPSGMAQTVSSGDGTEKMDQDGSKEEKGEAQPTL
jgi:hypothetical protein